MDKENGVMLTTLICLLERSMAQTDRLIGGLLAGSLLAAQTEQSVTEKQQHDLDMAELFNFRQQAAHSLQFDSRLHRNHVADLLFPDKTNGACATDKVRG